MGNIGVCLEQNRELGGVYDLSDAQQDAVINVKGREHRVEGSAGVGEREAPTDPFPPAVLRLANRPYRVAPAKDLPDRSALELADLVAHMSGRAIVDRAATALVVLRHVRGYARLPESVLGSVVDTCVSLRGCSR